LIEKYTEKSQKKFEEFFIFFSWVQLGPYGWAGPVGLTKSLA
jgi:hypothetical protein